MARPAEVAVYRSLLVVGVVVMFLSIPLFHSKNKFVTMFIIGFAAIMLGTILWAKANMVEKRVALEVDMGPGPGPEPESAFQPNNEDMEFVDDEGDMSLFLQPHEQEMLFIDTEASSLDPIPPPPPTLVFPSSPPTSPTTPAPILKSKRDKDKDKKKKKRGSVSMSETSQVKEFNQFDAPLTVSGNANGLVNTKDGSAAAGVVRDLPYRIQRPSNAGPSLAEMRAERTRYDSRPETPEIASRRRHNQVKRYALQMKLPIDGSMVPL
jgi:hypothetical protein